MSKFLALLLSLLSFPCLAGEWAPEIYPLRDGLIAPFDVVGSVEIVNDQPSTESQLVYKYGFTKLQSNYNAITDVFVAQAREELAKNGRAGTEGPAKTLRIKVTYLSSSYKFMYWRSKLRFEATLGDGTVIEKEVPHASGNPYQDLNGCIAESVMMLFRDEKLRAYLAAGSSPAAAPAAATEPTTQAAEDGH